MNDQELTDLLRQAKTETPKSSAQLAARTLHAYREGHARPSFFVRHWRMAAVAAAILIAITVVGTRSSVGSPLPPEYDRSGVISAGHLHAWNRWILDYSTVRRPSGGHSSSDFTTTDISERDDKTIVFHRYFGDATTNVYYGYDVVLHTSWMGTLGPIHVRDSNGTVTIEPLSEQPQKRPDQVRAAGSRILEVRELPSHSFQTGQSFAVTLLSDPATGQQVIDYVRVDTNIFDSLHHIAKNMLRAFHSHFEHHEPPVQ